MSRRSSCVGAAQSASTNRGNQAPDGEDPGNVYTIPEGGRVGVTLTAESVDGVEGCTAADADQVDIINTNGSGSTSLRLSLRVCQEMVSVAVSPYEPRS